MKEANETLVRSRSSHSRYGSWCVFVPLSESHGVKFYHNPHIAEKARDMQAEGHSFGLAPAVGDKFSMPTPIEWDDAMLPFEWNEWPEYVYGYITEIVSVGGENTVCDSDYNDLRMKMLADGFSTRDVGYQNVGYDANDNLVCHDWDPMYNLDNKDWLLYARGEGPLPMD